MPLMVRNKPRRTLTVIIGYFLADSVPLVGNEGRVADGGEDGLCGAQRQEGAGSKHRSVKGLEVSGT